MHERSQAGTGKRDLVETRIRGWCACMWMQLCIHVCMLLCMLKCMYNGAIKEIGIHNLLPTITLHTVLPCLICECHNSTSWLLNLGFISLHCYIDRWLWNRHFRPSCTT